MYKDGICQVTPTHFNKTIQFDDINYLLLGNSDKDNVLEQYSKFINYFDESMSVQLSFINRYGNITDYDRGIVIPPREDVPEHIRKEYEDMLNTQITQGNNGIVKLKYVTVGIASPDYKTAKSKLAQIELDVTVNLKNIGSKAYALSGQERLTMLHAQMHPDGKTVMNQAWEAIQQGGNTKDAIAPNGIYFMNPGTFRMGNVYGAVGYLNITATELHDTMLQEYLAMDNAVTVTIQLQPIAQDKAIKKVKGKMIDLQARKSDQQKKASREGYDYDNISTDLISYTNDAKSMLHLLQDENERLFSATIMVLVTADSQQKLENIFTSAKSIATKHNNELWRLNWQQEQALVSSLAIGKNEIPISRDLPTMAVAIFTPFTTAELFIESTTAMYYGQNALSRNIIMADRKSLKNPNALILGIPGVGKSFAAKMEIITAFITTNDDIFILDPEGEYAPLVKLLGGEVIALSSNSPHYINPMEIHKNYGDDDDPVAFKCDFILSMLEIIASGVNGLSHQEKGIIDRCTRKIYAKYFVNPTPENMPIMEDLLLELSRQDDPEARNITTALELYVTGSQRVFNNQTNVNIHNRLVCFDIKALGKSLKRLALLILQDAVWGRVTQNRNIKRPTWFYLDEFHLLLTSEQTAAFSIEIWKRFRKWGGIPTGITQNVKDFLRSPEISNIFDNSDTIIMLSQSVGDQKILAEYRNISESQLKYVTNAPVGHGLMFHGDITIPFSNRFPADTAMYKAMTTKLEEV